MISTILTVALLISLYFNFKYRNEIKQTIVNHLNELEAIEVVIERLEDRVNKATSVVSQDTPEPKLELVSRKKSKK